MRSRYPFGYKNERMSIMKRALAIPLVLSMCISLAACSNSSSNQQSNKPSYEELETQLQTVTEERDLIKSELDALKAEVEAFKEETTVQSGDVTVLVTDKTVTPKNTDQWIFSNYVNFSFSITNNTEKDIQGIQGELKVSDLFGAEILTVGCDFTGQNFAAGETITNDELSFECNEFMSDHMKLYSEDYKDLKFAYTVKQIVFTDGTVKES